MRNTAKAFWILAIFMFAAAGGIAKAGATPADDHESMVVVFKDGHRQNLDVVDIARIDFNAPAMIIFKDGHRHNIPAADVARIEFENSASASVPGRNHFVGKWQVGEGNGSKFYITLERDGKARKSIGRPHGTWTVEDGEARISWDDGWHDAIRKVARRTRSWLMNPASRSTTHRPTSPPPRIQSPNRFSRSLQELLASRCRIHRTRLRFRLHA
jgi:hypothetical protein